MHAHGQAEHEDPEKLNFDRIRQRPEAHFDHTAIADGKRADHDDPGQTQQDTENFDHYLIPSPEGPQT